LDPVYLWQQTLQTVYKGLDENINKNRAFASAIPNKSKLTYVGGITMVTHASVAKLEPLLFQIQRWGGPTSAGIYLASLKDITAFFDFLKAHIEFLENVSFHIFLEKTTSEYPHNILRNLALGNIETEFFLALDADFVTPSKCYQSILASVLSDVATQDLLRHKTFLVLPAFEAEESVKNNGLLPEIRMDVERMASAGTVTTFHLQNFQQGHGATNFSKWLNSESTSAPFYPVTYQTQFEPYVIGYRHGVPRYWPHFRGFGFNKVSWFLEAHHAGFQFAVLTDFWVIHLNHPTRVPLPSSGRMEPSEGAKNALGSFGEYMEDAYGLQWRYLKNIFGFSLVHTDIYRYRVHNRLSSQVRAAYKKQQGVEKRLLEYANTHGTEYDLVISPTKMHLLESFSIPVEERLKKNNNGLRKWLDVVEPLLVRSTLHPWQQLWDEEFLKAEHTHRRSFANSLPSKYHVERDMVTLATHASAAKLEQLATQVQRWGGPVSVALYLGSPEDIATFLEFYEASGDRLQQASFHVVMEKSSLKYPHNVMRNMALDNVESDYFLALDVDFMTSVDCHEKLHTLIKSDDKTRENLRAKTLFVLPAFERFNIGRELSPDVLPDNKTDVQRMHKEGNVSGFHVDNFPDGHGPTNFTKWLSIREGEKISDLVSYPIEYAPRFEPYVLGYKHGAPRYWPYFRGFGMNKLSWFVEADHAGYKYAVLNDFYVVHMNHEKETDVNKADYFMANLSRFFTFQLYLQEAYGVPMKDLKPILGGLRKRIDWKTEMDRALLSRRVIMAYNRQRKDRMLPVEDLLNTLYNSNAKKSLKAATNIKSWLDQVERERQLPNDGEKEY
jgi:hypothetical protein